MRKPTPRIHTSPAPARGHNSALLLRLPAEQLKFDDSDPRRYTKRDLELATAVISRMPPEAPLPVVVNDRNIVLVGQLVVKAAQAAKLSHVMVIVCSTLSDTQQKQYSVAINQLLSKGSWDPGDLDAWIREFENTVEDFSHLDLGFDNGELDRILGHCQTNVAGGARGR